MKDNLVKYNKYLKYDNPIIIENNEGSNKNSKDEKNMKEKNIVRVIEKIRKNLKSSILYKNGNKNIYLFNDPIYDIFPIKYYNEKKTEYISYVSKLTNDDDIFLCLKKIFECTTNIYSNYMIIKDEHLEELLSIFMEICRQVSTISFPRGILLKQLFNYNVIVLIHYHKLVKSSITFNLKKQTKQNDTLNNYINQIEAQKKQINDLKNSVLLTEQIIQTEKTNFQKELSKETLIYENKIDKLKKANQRKKDDFTRILQL
ncbi:dynein light chain, putative [Plasmodium yoelii]|uniref:Dynein light chain n=2 Tax=Plasmodium yoelii TaxID=5861 RepID=A0AAE9WWQ9_PLAYO|nr:dynein light chain, putative [Plasmodium yoelii]WBY58009.1 dynein light chain [Plasmodium yoelii yoelii]CDU85078.1 dynein-associated protein, putative [Plasmodium yoelii]VTZ78973.1 dynein light chain, putative [Plasmodium yoelii]|eukprot:XP_022813334.1 dynein light chain, putative [Plasmodium yoelii]